MAEIISTILAAVNLLVFLAGGIVVVRLVRRDQELMGEKVQENVVHIEGLETAVVALSSKVQLLEAREKWEKELPSRARQRLRK
jgi:outer membrane murein-binding lipoprotein Lpp